jgi:long-chain acyl-CoA synthetase
MNSEAAIRAQLTGPGGQFEVVREPVGDHNLLVYKDRFPNLCVVAQFGAAHGDKEFIVYGEERITYTEFTQRANSVSRLLGSVAGVIRGDRVAVLSANNPEWCLSFWGTLNLGAILVGLNGWWAADEIRYGLEDCGAKVLVADRPRFERIADQIDEIETLERVYLIDVDPAEVPASGRVQIRSFDELLTAPTDEFPAVDIVEDDPAVIFYTSGTTGRAKGAISTHRNMVANLQNTIFLLTLGARLAEADTAATTNDGAPEAETNDAAAAGAEPAENALALQPVALFTSPLFHVSGCHSTLVIGMMAGMRMVMPAGRFDPVEALRLIETERVMIWGTVPTMIWRVLETPERTDFDTSSVISVSFGGSPAGSEMHRKVRDTFPNLKAATNAYGLTESSSVATALGGNEGLSRPDSVGLAMPVVELAIAGSDGRHLGPNQTGEILIRGPIIMAGYWNKPEATAAAVQDGWLHTGDVGHLDDDGYLYVTDRAKDMIIRGGENVYCVEIEQRLVQHPAIADAAVIGVPHHTLGEEVKAVVQVEPGKQLTEADVRDWVADALAPFKVPTHVELRSEHLPRNASGKLLKNQLRGVGTANFAETM